MPPQPSPHAPLPTLPFHLALSLSAWISSSIASACLKNALPQWKGLEDLPLQVSAEAKAAVEELLKGVSLYQGVSFPPRKDDLPVVWRHGSARLLACMPETANGRKKRSAVDRQPSAVSLQPSSSAFCLWP